MCTESVEKMDEQIEKRDGQDVIDSLSVLEAVVPTFHSDLSHNFMELFPHVILALRSRFAIVRQSAARCFATICDVLTVEAMRYVIEKVVPYLGDAAVLSNRQGTIELIYREYLWLYSLPSLTRHARHCAETGHQGTAICYLHGRACVGTNERSGR